MEMSLNERKPHSIIDLLLFLSGPILWIVLFTIVKVSIPLFYMVIYQSVVSALFLFKHPKLFFPSLFFVILLASTYLPLSENLWVLRILISVGVLMLLLWLILPLRKLRPAFKLGNIDKAGIIYALLTITISTTALFAWKALAKPDIKGFISTALNIDSALILPAIIVFPIFNAIAEELMFRWLFWDGLNQVIDSGIAIILIQAIVFGLAHYQGFPSGWLGASMAGCYGLMLGFIRYKNKGLLMPTLTHIFADLVIIIIVFSSAGIL